MPDPRPMASSIRFGQYDEPPASESRTRRSRLNQALRATADMAVSDLAEMGASTQPTPNRRALLSPAHRRRQRSPASELRDGRDTGSSDELRRRRPKRRKLDSDPRKSQKPIKYGHCGQVVTCKLSLDIISCDGGEHRDQRHPGTSLGPENMLRHDKSVYCSERSSSNVVLRHTDDTPFCLEKLHIVGPEHGFTAPVREGLVYVAMSLNDLSKYMDPPHHARRVGVHSPPYRRQRSFRSPPEQITLADALRDPVVSAALDVRVNRDHTSPTDDANDVPEDRRYRSPYVDENQPHRYSAASPCDYHPAGTDSDPASVDDEWSSPITLLSDEETGPEESSSQEVLEFRLQRLQNMRRRFGVDDYDRDEEWSSPQYPRSSSYVRDGSWGLRHLDAMMARSRMADSPQREDASASERNAESSGPSIPSSSSYYSSNESRPDLMEYYEDGLHDPNVVRARFHIRRGKHKVAIKFDPPVSGRFILLKLWAHRSNVDVQSVIAKGYGGLRFFPALEFR